MKKFLSVTKVCELLDCKPSVVYKWMDTGQIKSYKFGGMKRVALEDLQAFADVTHTLTSDYVCKLKNKTEV